MKKPELWKLEEADKNPFFGKPEEVVKPFTMRDLEKLLNKEAADLLEACRKFATGETKALKEDFNPAKAMREIAAQQKALGYEVTADPAEVLKLVDITTEEETEEVEAA